MASTRKVRHVNRRFAKVNEEWPDKDATGSVHRNKTRKRKLSDMLGSQWSKEELERFYEAYRKYGKDWRKVATAIRCRTSEMVEALYSMNRAYLSLPEGTATAAGLIAMMIDHYNILEGTNSDRESNESPKTSRRLQKRGRAKFRLMSKTSNERYPDLLQYQPSSSSYGCLSLLKKKRSGGSRPRAVGKRTPRVPVSNMYIKDEKDKLGLLNRQVKSDVNTGDDEGAHVAALALAEVSQRAGSPQVSQTPGRGADKIRFSPVKSGEKKNADSEMGSSKFHGFHMDGDGPECSLGSREAENGDCPKDMSFLMTNEGSGSGKAQQRSQRRRQKVPRSAHDRYDDDREACSGTEEGHSGRKMKDEADTENLESKIAWPSTVSKKRSRQLFFGDESSALDALHTLADLSVNILQPSSILESESSAHFKDDNKDNDSDEKLSVPVPMSVYKQRDSRISGKKDKSEGTNADIITRKKAKLAKVSRHDGNHTSEVKDQTMTCGIKTEKKKRKYLTGKNLKDEVSSDIPIGVFEKKELLFQVPIEERRISSVKGRRSQVSPVSRQGKPKPQENSLACTVSGIAVIDNTGTTAEAVTATQANLLSKSSLRKMGILKAPSPQSKVNESTGDYRADKFSYPVNSIAYLKEKLSHCISSRLLRRWCMFEWFYSAIDYPWFAKSEFVEYLNHVKLCNMPMLTRVEWGIIRSSLGKPRRLSKQFLQEERDKLAQYRESVRKHYTELQAGIREGFPTDLARPFSVGQRVIACHPRSRELNDGIVLSVDHNRCRVQYDRPELGVEFVKDIDCMPLYPLENVPESLRKQNLVNKYSNSFSDTKLEDRPMELGVGGSTRYAPKGSFETADATSHITSNHPMNTLIQQAKGDTIDSIVQAKATVNGATVAAQQAMYSQPCSLSQIQEREADIRALAELSRALDKKEALLIELRHMNEEVSGKQNDGETISDLEHFRKQYAMVLLQLRDANDQVASTLLSLRQRNTYHENTQSWPRPMEKVGAFAGPPEACSLLGFINHDSGSQVVEVIETSRRKARVMVDAAVQAMHKMTEGEDAFVKIGEALDNINNRSSGSGSSILGIRRIPPDSGQANSAYQENKSCTFNSELIDASNPRICNGDDAEVQFPSDLISSCVATLLMIKNCTDRQYPPAEVAHILDSAVASLQPCSSQNLPIFREIETCMGVIKNQMLALIPTSSTGDVSIL